MQDKPMTPTPRGLGIHAAPQSRVPRIIGILMLVFGGLGLLWTLGLAADGSGALRPGWWLAVELSVSALHLTAGVLALRGHRAAPLAAATYGATTLLTGAMLLPPLCQPPPDAPAGSSPFMHGIDHMLTTLAVWVQTALRVAWAIVAVVLMNTASTRMACRSSEDPPVG